MSTLPLREDFVRIAERDVGQTETTRNRGPAMKKYWPATNYPDGYANREPYCAAAMCYWLREWLKNPAVLDALKLTPAAAERWRCKSARAFDWMDWAAQKKLQVFNDAQHHVLHTADIMVFDMSHVGVVQNDRGSSVFTIEANTGPSGGRDGDGVWAKVRERSLARQFIRILP